MLSQRMVPVRVVLCMAVALACLVTAPAALAAKGGKNALAASSGLRLDVVGTTDDVPHWGQDVAFAVSTGATNAQVALNCSTSAGWVYAATAPVSGGWSSALTLANGWWTSGPGDCTATLFSSVDGMHATTLATLPFHVEA
jgi:hypothetical protein